MNPFGGFGAGGGLTIYQDVNENTANPGLQRTKRVENVSKQAAVKRTALGVITNQTRVQPARAAKQPSEECFGRCENAKVGGKTFGSQGFTIHADDGSSYQNSKPSGQRQTNAIQSVIASLDSRQPLASLNVESKPPYEVIEIEESPERDSPMILDQSCDLGREETPEQRFQRLLSAAEYSHEIYEYVRECERRQRPKAGYMKKQPDITYNMRCILIDWLVEVAEEYKLHRETLCLAVNYLDRFLSQMSVLRGKLQLVGAACMFLASKYEEIYPPEVNEFVYITDDTYTQKQILRMEHLVLKVLDFQVAVPTVNFFCDKFLGDISADDKTKSLAMYLCEMTLVDADPFLNYLPSEIAAAAICLANYTLGHQPCSSLFSERSSYQLEGLQECVKDLYQAYTRAATHPQQAVREKYKQSKYHQVSLLSPPTSLAGIVH